MRPQVPKVPFLTRVMRDPLIRATTFHARIERDALSRRIARSTKGASSGRESSSHLTPSPQETDINRRRERSLFDRRNKVVFTICIRESHCFQMRRLTAALANFCIASSGCFLHLLFSVNVNFPHPVSVFRFLTLDLNYMRYIYISLSLAVLFSKYYEN